MEAFVLEELLKITVFAKRAQVVASDGDGIDFRDFDDLFVIPFLEGFGKIFFIARDDDEFGEVQP